MRSILAITLLIAASGAWAQHRCVENGKTVITDRPCQTERPALEGNTPGRASNVVVGDAANSAYSSPYGIWRGQVQFQGTAKGNVVQEAMSVVPMTIEIDPQGKIKGSSPENGCTAQGIASPGISPTAVNLDITFSNCRYAGFNRRLNGWLVVNSPQKHAQFSLGGNNENVLGTMVFFDIKGTLRR